MKRSNKVLILIVIVIFSTVFFLGCKPTIDTAKGALKPDIHSAMVAYGENTQKKSHFEAGITFTMFKGSTKGSNKVDPFSFGQLLTADRIQNGEKVYIDATIGSANVSENFIGIINLLTARMRAAGGKNVEMDDSIMDYVSGKTLFAGRVAYDGIDTYNGKGDYINKEESPNYLDDDGNPIWFATNEQSVQNIQKNFGIQGEISPKDYFMFSTMLDMNPDNGWAKSDIADKYFDAEKDAYLYNITTYGAKLKGLILGAMGEQEIFDEEEYAEELLRYASIYPKIASWISTPDSSVEAKVDRNNKLQSLSSEMRIDININIKELKEIITRIMPESEDRILKVITAVSTLNYLSSSAGKAGIWTIRIDFTTNETFSYDAASIDLSKVDQEMFLPSTDKNNGRVVIDIPLDEA